MAFTCRQASLLGALVVLLTLACMTSALEEHKFRKAEDTGFAIRNRALAKQVPSGYLQRAEVLANSVDAKSSEITFHVQVYERHRNGAADESRHALGAPVHVTLRAYSDAFVRATARPADESAQKRHEVRFVLDDGLEKRRTEFKQISREKDGELRASFGPQREVVVSFAPFRVTLRLAGNDEVVWNARDLFHFETSVRAPLTDAPADKEDEVMKDVRAQLGDRQEAESFGQYKDSKPNGPSSLGVDFALPRAKALYGLPERTIGLTLRPTTRAKTAQGGAEILSQPYRLYNLDVFEYAIDHPMGLYGAIPFLMSHGGESTTGIFWLNSAEMFVDVHETADKSLHTHWYAESGVIDVFLYAGDTPADVLAQFVETTGKPYMPPLFSVAYHQCRWNYKNEKDVAQVDGKFDEHDIPFDVLWLDIEHTDGKRYFTWDKTHFPTPVAMQERLAVKGRKMVTIIDPHIKIDEGFPVYREAREKGYFVKNAQGSEFQGDCWPGRSAWLDYTDERVRQYWAELFSYDRYQGSSPTLFTWNDMNEPAIFSGPEATMDKDAKHLDGTEHREVHNQYGFLQAMSTVQGQRLRAPTERPFVLSRSFFAGSQKYHAVWTGDNMAKWDHLRAGQHMLLTLGLSALPFVGADVGGFFYNPDPELLVRWYQAGAYYPFFRAHAHIETKRREPWLFGDENTARIRDAIRARYHLLPYVYTVFRISHETGLPVMRPLFLQYPRQVDLFGVYDQFLVGADVMVAPVLSAGAATVDVVVPDGSVWFQVPTGKKFTEGKHSVPVDMSGIPVFYRGGSIVPKKERLRRSSALMVHDPYTLVVSLDANRAAQGKLYLDDGHSTAFERGEAAVVTFTLDTHGALTASKVGSFACDNKVERIVFYGAESAPRAIRVGDRALESTFSDGVLTVRKPDVAVTGGWTMTISWT